MSARKVLIDTDTGIDDSLALLVALAEPGVEVVGIGPTYGNCASAQAAQNALHVLEVAGAPPVPVASAVPEPASARALIDWAAHVHGQDGLGELGLCPSHLNTSREDAVEQLLRISRGSGAATELLAIGPLTNLAAALRMDGEVLSRFRSVTIMGSMGPEWLAEEAQAAYPGFRTVGDPNTRHDPEAAGAVAATRANVTWVGMNVTGSMLFPMALLDELAERGSAKASFTQATHRLYGAFVTRAYNSPEPVFTAHDTVAATVMLSPTNVFGAVQASPSLVFDSDGRGSIWGTAPVPGRSVHRFITRVEPAEVEKRIRLALGD
jgi:purine nucleosidase